jgi:hypothetical protein
MPRQEHGGTAPSDASVRGNAAWDDVTFTSGPWDA